MSDFKRFLKELYTDLRKLREKEVKYAGDAPLDLPRQIRDYDRAINLTEQAIKESWSENELRQAIREEALIISNDLQQFLVEAGSYQTPKLILKLFNMDRDKSHRDEIFLSQANRPFPQDHLFGFALENIVALTMAKGIKIDVRFANRTNTRIAPRFEAPNLEGWITQIPELVNEQEAILTFESPDLICLPRHPERWNNFKLTLWEQIEGYMLISYDVTSIQPLTESDGKLEIHLNNESSKTNRNIRSFGPTKPSRWRHPK